LAQAQELSEVVAKIEAGDALTTLEAKIIEGGGSPLGGAKPKALIDIDGEQWVIKFFNNEYVDAPLIEHATMTLAAQAGINVAQTQVIHLVAANALAIRRFDRVDGQRIHSISAGTAIRAATAGRQRAGNGIPATRPNPASSRRQPGRRASGRCPGAVPPNGVQHPGRQHRRPREEPRAFSRVRPTANGRLRLAPAYDVLPTNSGQGYQEFICGAYGQASTLANAMSQCDAFGLQPAQAAVQVVQVIEVVNTWRAHFEAIGVSNSDLESLAERLDGDELLSQRQTFDASQYQGATAPNEGRQAHFAGLDA
jgi:serine/threonine-protein kinase HipA